MSNKNTIKNINKDTINFVKIYDFFHYFMSHKDLDNLYESLMNICSYELNKLMNGLPDTLAKNFLSRDVNDHDIDLLSANVSSLNNTILKARIYHILFLHKKPKDRNDAIESIKNYYESAISLIENESYHLAIDQLFMMIYLSNIIRYSDPLLSLAKRKLLDIFDHSDYKIEALIAINTLQTENKDKIISLANNVADELISIGEENIALKALEISLSNIHTNEKESISSVNRKIADIYISIARNSNGIRSAHFLLNAINTLAKFKNTRSERLSLYEEMRDYQLESLIDLKHFETEPYDISPLLEDTKKILDNTKNWFDMLFRIGCCISDIREINNIKKNCLDRGKSLTDILFSQPIYIDNQGMNISESDIPSIIDFNDIPIKEREWLWSNIVFDMKISHSLSCNCINEALRILHQTYTIKYEDILKICVDNPFIPKGHEEFFAKGIFYGLNGDFLTANHLLIPQIENSLRHLLQLQAEEPTTLHGNNEQERDGLNKLLDDPRIIKIFGIDGILHLRTILIDKQYPGLRHPIAHGFLESSYFNGGSAIYIWWLILRIIMFNYRKYWEEHYAPKT